MNNNPRTAQIEAFKWQRNDRELGKVIGTRYPVEVQSALLAMSQSERQDFIRAAVESALQREGLL